MKYIFKQTRKKEKEKRNDEEEFLESSITRRYCSTTFNENVTQTKPTFSQRIKSNGTR